MKLKYPTSRQIIRILAKYNKGDGNDLNKCLTRLFKAFSDNNNKHEVQIKAVALNQIYSTSIYYIEPIVDTLIKVIPKNSNKLLKPEFIDLVDNVSKVSWKSQKGEMVTRTNISFSSKYIHFLSNKTIPIYDSYIWILIIAYLRNFEGIKYSFSKPKSYKEFYSVYLKFIKCYKLSKYNEYQIDKYLWQYCKELLTVVAKKYKTKESKSKLIAELKLNC